MSGRPWSVMVGALRARRSVIAVLIAAVAGMAGCGGSGTGTSDDSLSGGVADTRAYYQILDLTSGRVSTRGAISDLVSNPVYRTTKLVFRLVDLGSGTIGTGASGLGATLDPAAGSVSTAPFYLAVFETTQAQWQLLAGSSPWAQLSSLDGSDDVRIGDSYPAMGLSHDLVTSSLQAYRGSHHVRLGLPSDGQWELACRGGGGGTWSWGDTADATTVAASAVVWETAGTVRGARPVAERAPSALGFYDLHGNVWELTNGTTVRGGSWNDPVTTARAAHRATIDPLTRHLLVGARLVYEP